MNAPHEPPSGAAHAAQRVLVLSSELPPGPGGIGTHAHSVAVALAHQGREVALLGCQHYASPAEVAQFNATSEVPIETLSDGPDPLRTARRRLHEIQAAIESFRPDVLLASGGRITWLAEVASQRTGVPVVAVTHGTELGGPGWQRRLTRRALNRSDRIIAVSNFTAGLVRSLGVQSRPVDVVPNGADGARFGADPERRARFRATHHLGDRPVILTVGNVTERKGQHLVVAALPQVLKSAPDAVYVLVGRGTEAAAIETQAQELGVAGHVVMLGQVDADEVVDAHAAADVFAMTSTNTGSGDVEGFGIAVLEAALCGVPAVVTTGTGAQEAVSDEMTGLAVSPAGDAIAAALTSLLTDPARRTTMGAAAQDAARTTATWPHRVARYGEIVDEAVCGTRPRIVVVSHTEHYTAADGSIVAFGPTTRELDQLATLACELVHIAPLHAGPPPGMTLRAEAPNVRFVAVRPAGGPRSVDRLLALRAVPQWVRIINREMRTADVAHVRCPAGISMVALAVLLVRRTPRHRWVKYAGNWAPTEPDAITYRVQRSWLRRGWARATVTVNGRWPDQPPWIRAFDNPTLTTDETAAGRAAAHAKQPGPPYRVVFAGRLEGAKGADVVVDTVLELRRRGLDVEADLIGDGPLRSQIEATVRAGASSEGGRDGTDLTDVIRLHGWLRRDELEGFLERGHVFLLPTASEGFPKVLAEAMAFGCVPVASDVSSLGQVLGETGGAVVVGPGESWADAVEQVLRVSWADLASTGLDGVDRFGFEHYLTMVRELAADAWGIRL